MIASLYQRGSSVSPKTSGGILAIIPVREPPQGSPRFLIRHCTRRSAPEGSGRVPRRPVGHLNKTMTGELRWRPEFADDSHFKAYRLSREPQREARTSPYL